MDDEDEELYNQITQAKEGAIYTAGKWAGNQLHDRFEAVLRENGCLLRALALQDILISRLRNKIPLDPTRSLFIQAADSVLGNNPDQKEEKHD